MNLIQILEVPIDCSKGDISIVIIAIKTVFTLIQWAIPLVLIIMGTIDMFKAMSSGDEKVTKEAQQKFIRRLIYAVVAFLIPFIISLIFTFVGNMTSTSDKVDLSSFNQFMACWSGKNVVASSGNETTTKWYMCYDVQAEKFIGGKTNNCDNCGEWTRCEEIEE